MKTAIGCLARVGSWVLVALVCTPGVNIGAENAPGVVPSLRNGVYSEEQRKSGRTTYLKQCSGCHGESLRGSTSAPALTGPGFVAHWQGRSLDELVEKLRQMPPNDPARLSDEDEIELVAVILAANHFPAGQRLSTDSGMLHQLVFVEPSGASEPRLP